MPVRADAGGLPLRRRRAAVATVAAVIVLAAGVAAATNADLLGQADHDDPLGHVDVVVVDPRVSVPPSSSPATTATLTTEPASADVPTTIAPAPGGRHHDSGPHRGDEHRPGDDDDD